MNEQKQEQEQHDEILPVQPGHVMHREHYERMARDAAQPLQQQK